MLDETLLAYFGHHRCASRWIIAILRELCARLDMEFRVVNTFHSFDGDLLEYLRHNHTGFLAYRNAEYRYVSSVPSIRGFHVYRDPRDIVISAYFSHLHSHPTKSWPELAAHREHLKRVSQDEGLFMEINFLDSVFRALREWNFQQDRVMEVRMEDLITNPCGVILNVCGYLGVISGSITREADGRLTSDDVLSVVHEHRFSVQSAGRKAGEEDVSSHFRKGVAGDWRNYFTPDHILAFKEQHNDLLIRMGYESGLNW